MSDEAEGVEALFDKHEDEFGEFERIPEADRRHPRRDLCAMLYLHERFGGDFKAVCHAEHDEIWLDWEPDQLTEADVIYVVRCGVRYSDDSLCMFV